MLLDDLIDIIVNYEWVYIFVKEVDGYYRIKTDWGFLKKSRLWKDISRAVVTKIYTEMYDNDEQPSLVIDVTLQ